MISIEELEKMKTTGEYSSSFWKGHKEGTNSTISKIQNIIRKRQKDVKNN